MLTNCLAACAHLTITVSEIQRDICEKIVYFIIPPLHSTGTPRSRRNISTPFGIEKLEWCRYPTVKKFRRYLYSFWRDPRTWQADRRTPGEIKDRAYAYASRGKNRYFYHIFVSPGDAPAIITQYVAWMESQFSARQTPRSMYLSRQNIVLSIRITSCNGVIAVALA